MSYTGIQTNSCGSYLTCQVSTPTSYATHWPFCPHAKPMSLKKRKMGEEQCMAVREEVDKLLKAQFIREIKYSTWFANVIMVKKSQLQMTDVHQLHRSQQGVPQGCISFAQHRQASQQCIRVPITKFPGCLFKIQSNQYACPKWRKNNIRNWGW